MKRVNDSEQGESKAAKAKDDSKPKSASKGAGAREKTVLDFEDPYGDDIESEDEVLVFDENGELENEDEDGDKKMDKEQRQRVYLPHRSAPLGVNEVMEPDYSTYHMLHNVQVKWPCLSFDIIPDKLGVDREKFPHAMYLTCGSQAKQAKDNEISILKLSSLNRTRINEDSEEEDEEDYYDDDPILESKSIPVKSTVNRLRITPFSALCTEYLVASMQEDGTAQIWDLTPYIHSFETPGSIIPKTANMPLHTIKTHSTEGYAVDWSPLVQTGQLLTGDIDGNIFLTSRTTSHWATGEVYRSPNGGSVEELQWSPVERTVFASAGSDGHMHIWDVRQNSHKPALSVKASSSDVNVMSWSHTASHLLASGHDDGSWSAWDLRTFTSGTPVANFGFHCAPITTIEFHPKDESVIAVGSEDSTCTLWDLAVEADNDEAQQGKDSEDLADIPAQLLFVHWQPNVKELHWHKQIKGTLVSTGSEGLNLWRTISV